MSFGEESLIRLSLQILSALHALHEKNLIHRDVKPANIVKLSGIDVYKLIDLGVAAVVAMRDEEVNQSLITQGTVLGFPDTRLHAPGSVQGSRQSWCSLGRVVFCGDFVLHRKSADAIPSK